MWTKQYRSMFIPFIIVRREMDLCTREGNVLGPILIVYTPLSNVLGIYVYRKLVGRAL